MRRSIFWLLDHYPELGESSAQVFSTAIEQAALVERLGFDSLWLAEHHFEKLGTSANPAILLTAIARHTRTLRLGPAVAVLPLRNPIHVAEDYALVDLLSEGRLNMGVGSGSRPLEFAGFDADFDMRHERFQECLEILRECWNGSRAGEEGFLALNVAPVQREGPPIYVAAMGDESAYAIGHRGDSMLTLISPMTDDLEDIASRVAAHRRGLHEAGHDEGRSESIVMVFAYVADSMSASKAVACPALTRLITRMAGAPPPDPDALFKTMCDRGTGLFGSEVEVSSQIARYRDLGLSHLALITRFGGMTALDSEQSLRQLAPHTP